MNREFSGWGVIATGGLLALAGSYWLYAGWEHIQIERGWSQFIAGAMALSGGVVTMAIGRLIRLLVTDPRIISSARATPRQSLTSPSARPAGRNPEPQRGGSTPQRLARPAPPVANNVSSNFDEPAPQETAKARHETAALPIGTYASVISATATPPVSDVDDWRLSETHRQGGEEPTEVDRYTAGDSTYVMYSDGAVEVRTPGGVRLYESLDDLRANGGER